MPHKSAPKPRPVGRPKSRPDGAKPRLHWLTDIEHMAVRALVRRLRGRTKSNTGDAPTESPK